MSRSNKVISYGRFIVRNLHTINVLTSSQNTKVITHFRMLPTPCQARRGFCNLSGNQELPPPPPPPSSSNWGKWTAGIMVIVIPLLQFKEEVDVVIKTAEEIIDVVEVVAEAVDMVAEKIDEDLLEDSKLKTTVELVEDVAEAVAEKAEKVIEFIDEVQAAEKKLEPVIEPVKQLTQVDSSSSSAS